jgi:myb proto-oncogene protein
MGHHSCCNQQKVKRGLWSPEEDEKLIRYITTHGYGCWSEVPEKAGTYLSLSSYLSFETLFLVLSIYFPR